MSTLTKEFLNEKEVLFVGYSLKNNAFSKSIYQAFTNRGTKVYPLNTNSTGNSDVKVYKGFEELPKVPSFAYVLLNKNNATLAIEKLAKNGVNKVLFQNKKVADEEIMSKCRQLGINVAVGCPMMILGTGLHKLHAFFAGVK